MVAVCMVVLASSCQTAVDPGNGGGNGGGGNGGGNGGDLSFARDIVPIFAQYCTSCHSEGGLAENDVPLRLTADRAYNAIVNQTSSQDASWTIVTPGDPAASLLYQKISQTNPPVGSRMPLNAGVVAAADQELIRLWIEQGAENN
jgi:hypothetical protein